MVFSSLTFISIFLPVVFGLYLVVPNMQARNVLLIAASLFFYAFGEPVYVVLMIVSSLANYAFARGIGAVKSTDQNHDVAGNASAKSKALLAAAVILNLAFLGVFKYAAMFVQTMDSLFGLSWAIPDIALPIGISFYTFQAMSYVIDVYRGEVHASRSYLKVLLYISFFAQLIAGPIIKYHDVEKQLDSRKVTAENIAIGLRRFSVGLGKKVLIANTMAVVVDSIYSADVSQVNIAVAWIAALAYIMQIYFDFSGYSDMAIGLARVFGFHYKENFNYPYTSSSIKEFWRRWHISLSTWFKEYLYVPLGGNRSGRFRTGANKVIVFFCCGLWHGASWTFVLWGLFHGLFLLLEEYIPMKRLPKLLGILYALFVVTVGFVLFRADSLDQAGYFIVQMFTGFHFEAACNSLALQQLTPLFLTMFAIAVLACTPLSRALKKWLDMMPANPASQEGCVSIAADGSWSQQRSIFRKAARIVSFGLSIILLFLCIISLSGGGYNPFIYFRF